MARIIRIAAAALFVGGASVALPVAAGAQTATRISIATGDVIGAYRVLGVVKAKYHQKSMFPSKPAQEALNDALRAEAAKLGADAVIHVKYTMVNHQMSREGHSVEGVAVKFEAAPASAPGATTTAAAAPTVPPPIEFGPTGARPQVQTQVVAPPVAPPAAPPPAPTAMAALTPAAPVPLASPLPAEVIQPRVIQPPALPAAPPQVVQPSAPLASTPPALAAAPMMSPAGPPSALAAASVAAPAPAVVTRPKPTSPDMVLVSEQDIINQGYEKVGDVSARWHQKTMFAKRAPQVELEAILKAEAFKLGADAVIFTKYKYVNSQMSREGHSATGVAVKLK